jgi:protein disulfide-isomerase
VKTFRLSFVALLLATFSAAAAGSETAWQTDMKAALAQAKAEHKLLLVNFTGSDWCGWCIRLNSEVFSTPAFQKYAHDNLVLMEVDFPHRKSQAVPVRLQNQELAAEYGIQGFPTIVVLNSDGQAVGALGYMPGGPEPFIAELQKLRKG